MIGKIEYSDRTAIEQYQLEKLVESLHYLNKNSTYYKSLFDIHKINPAEIKSIAAFQKIPTTSKNHLQEYNMDFLCIPTTDVAEWITTSGTLGSPVSFALSKNDLTRLAKNEARSLAITACNSNDTIQLMVTLDKRFMAGLAYYLGAQHYGATTIRVGSGSPGLQLDSILRFHPQVMIAVPSFLLNVLQYAEKNNIELPRHLVKKIICIGEPIRDQQYQLNNLGKRIKAFWPSVELYSTYASTEMSTAITECKEGQGGHIPTELIYIELLDENDQPVPDGEPGEVCITSLGIEAMPLLRYKTGDVCVKNATPCSCGINSYRLSPVLGRKKQMMKYRGTTLFPETIYELLNGITAIKDYIVLIESNEIETDDLTLIICSDKEKDREELILDVTEKCNTHLRVKPQIRLISVPELRKIKYPSTSRKPLKLIDKRKKNY